MTYRSKVAGVFTGVALVVSSAVGAVSPAAAAPRTAAIDSAAVQASQAQPQGRAMRYSVDFQYLDTCLRTAMNLQYNRGARIEWLCNPVWGGGWRLVYYL